MKNSDPADSKPPSLKNVSVLELKRKSFSFSNFRIEVVSDIDECHKLWQKFSPMKTFFDTWEFSFSFYLSYKYQPYFFVLKKENERLALLPLWYEDNDFEEKNKKRFTWFGSDWREEVPLLGKKPDYIAILLQNAPIPFYLNAIDSESAKKMEGKIELQPDNEPKYVLGLESFKSQEDFLMTLKKNSRRNLRKDRNKILKQNPEIIINNFDDFNDLVSINKARNKDKGVLSALEDPRLIEAFKNIIKFTGKSYQIRMITVKINGKIAGVDLNALFGKTYLTLYCGYNVKEFPGIGNFFNLFEIDDAIKLGMKKIDFLQNNYKWKEKYFQSIPLFKIEKC